MRRSDLVAARQTRLNPSPHAATVELDSHTIRRIDRALVPTLNPNVARPIHPSARRYTNFVYNIEIPAVLGNYSGRWPCAVDDAPIGPESFVACAEASFAANAPSVAKAATSCVLIERPPLTSDDVVFDAQPLAQPHSGVVVERQVRFGDGTYLEVVRPSAQRAVQLFTSSVVSCQVPVRTVSAWMLSTACSSMAGTPSAPGRFSPNTFARTCSPRSRTLLPVPCRSVSSPRQP